MARKKPINNCALENGDEQKNCQMCMNACPNAEKTVSRESVRHVALEGSRYLVTVPQDSQAWCDEELTEHFRRMTIKDSIVRLRPPEKSTDDDVERLRKFFLKAGAAKVVVLPRPRAELLPAQATKAKAVGAREAVIALISESNSKDRAALVKLCEGIMSKVDL